MPRQKRSRSSVSIVGPGRLGTALALSLRRARWRVDSLVVRGKRGPSSRVARLARQVGARIADLGKTPPCADVVWITAPDDAIAEVTARLASNGDWRRKIVFHSSGALTSDVLAPLGERGASVASVHPGMTFVSKSVPSMSGVPFGVEGDARAVRLAKQIIADMGGTTITIHKKNKILYHAFDTLASPLLIGLMATLEQVGIAAGIPKSRIPTMAGPLLRRTLENYLEHGAASAHSGALVRGDAVTIKRHLEALKATPHARRAYVALARVIVRKLPVTNRKALEKELR